MTKKIDLDSDLLLILKTENFNKFTVLELRSAYLAICIDKKIHKTEARRFVYRHILRLENNGLLKRTDSKKTDKTIYTKTKIFDVNKFNAINLPVSGELDINTNEPASLSKDLLQSLIDKLQGYKAELLISIGETDEYKSLCREYPQLKEQLQESYNLARENSRKIIGNVKALEKTIKLQKQDQQT